MKTSLINKLITAKAINIVRLLKSNSPTGFKRVMFIYAWSHSYNHYPVISLEKDANIVFDLVYVNVNLNNKHYSLSIYLFISICRQQLIHSWDYEKVLSVNRRPNSNSIFWVPWGCKAAIRGVFLGIQIHVQAMKLRGRTIILSIFSVPVFKLAKYINIP